MNMKTIITSPTRCFYDVSFPFAQSRRAIRQVDADASGTTVCFRYYGQEGYWFRIAKDSYLEANGKRYKATAANGITFDENNYPKLKASAITDGIMSKQFFTDFTLNFEPFETIPETFDFKEGDGEGAFVIRNVSVK